MTRPNPKSKGIFGTKGLINPRARRRQVGSAEFSMPRALRSVGQSLNDRRAEKESEETEEANNELQSGGVPYAQAFDDGSGGGKQCVINEDGEIDCTGQPEGEGGNSGVKDGLARGAQSKSLGDLFIAMANNADDRKRERQKTYKTLARFFEDRSTIGNHDAQLNLPMMQLVARHFDRRGQKVKSRRSRGNNYGYASL